MAETLHLPVSGHNLLRPVRCWVQFFAVWIFQSIACRCLHIFCYSPLRLQIFLKIVVDFKYWNICQNFSSSTTTTYSVTWKRCFLWDSDLWWWGGICFCCCGWRSNLMCICNIIVVGWWYIFNVSSGFFMYETFLIEGSSVSLIHSKLWPECFLPVAESSADSLAFDHLLFLKPFFQSPFENFFPVCRKPS